MKQSPELEAIQQKLRPGVITAEGFLGTDPRPLSEIIETDDAAVARLGLTHELIARKMRDLHDAGIRGLGEFVEAGPHLEVRVDSVRGKLPCPFGDRGLEQKGFTVVRNKKLGHELSYTDLITHMIAAHGFYEGRGSPFRLEPTDLAAVLEIERPEEQ
jgi:hypothetical protein